MEFTNSKNVSAREIALAFGVPPMILGIPGDNTYANYAEANRALWRLTLLPLLEKMCSGMNTWLTPRFGADLKLGFDQDKIPALTFERDAIPALTFERDALWNRIGLAPFLTPNEKRKMLGFEPVKSGALRDSISVVTSEDGLTLEITADAPHAPAVEFGTRRMPARPFMVPAAGEEFPKIKEALIKTLNQAIKN